MASEKKLADYVDSNINFYNVDDGQGTWARASCRLMAIGIDPVQGRHEGVLKSSVADPIPFFIYPDPVLKIQLMYKLQINFEQTKFLMPFLT